MPYWRPIGAALAVLAYALFSHWLMLYAVSEPWAVAALFGPLLVVVFGVAARRRHAPSLLACAALVLVLVIVVARGGVDEVSRLYLLQHAGIHLALGWTFAVTLRPGSTALISALAAQVHGPLSTVMQAYTRRLTMIWVGYFLGMVVASLTLYTFAPWSWWSAFANLFTPFSAVAFFVAEHALRYRLHPEFERASLTQALRAYREAVAAKEARR